VAITGFRAINTGHSAYLRSLFLFGAALAVFLGSVLVAQEKAGKKTHKGTFVSAKGDEFAMADKAGKEHKHMLARNGKVLAVDGREC
jgi:hypothetical protein